MFLYAVLFTSAAASAIAVPAPDSTLTPSSDLCRFTLGSNRYDLCPILSGATAGTGPAVLPDGEGVHDHVRSSDFEGTVSCPPGTQSCIPATASRSEVDKVGSLGLQASQSSDKAIMVELRRASGGSTVLRLECDLAVELEWAPLWDAMTRSWRTKHACALPATSEADFRVLEADSDAADDAPPQDEEDGDQLLDAGDRSSRRAAAITFVVVFSFVISLCVLSYKRPHFFSETITPLFQRTTVMLRLPALSLPATLSFPKSLRPTGEGRLVRWAQEDMELDAEDDVMVNGGDTYDDLEAVGDEYIPLRPSPRKMKGGRWIKNYGSASTGGAAKSFW